jgi:predicted NBD/HSP70 family sugar kinase
MIKDQGVNPKLVRQMNSSQVLNLIKARGEISRSMIGRHIHLSKAAVTDIVRGLEEKKLVEEVGPGRSLPVGGRKPTLLKFNPNAGFLAGVGIDPGSVTSVITNLAGEIKDRKKISIPPGTDDRTIIDRICEMINTYRSDLENKNADLIGVGIGCPAVIDYEKGVVLRSSILGWENLPLKQLIEKKCSLPAAVDDNARVEALGEYSFGIARNLSNIVYLSIGSGVGAGVFTEGRLYRGTNNAAGEIGHIQMAQGGPRCGCGNRGCLEAFVSENSILTFARENSGIDGTLTLDQVFTMESTKELVQQAARYLARAVSLVGNCFDPEMIVLGGSTIQKGGKYFFELIKEQTVGTVSRIEMSTLGEDSGVIGAAALAYQEIFMNHWLHLSGKN